MLEQNSCNILFRGSERIKENVVRSTFPEGQCQFCQKTWPDINFSYADWLPWNWPQLHLLTALPSSFIKCVLCVTCVLEKQQGRLGNGQPGHLCVPPGPARPWHSLIFLEKLPRRHMEEDGTFTNSSEHLTHYHEIDRTCMFLFLVLKANDVFEKHNVLFISL